MSAAAAERIGGCCPPPFYGQSGLSSGVGWLPPSTPSPATLFICWGMAADILCLNLNTLLEKASFHPGQRPGRRATSRPVALQCEEDSIHGRRRLIHVVVCPVSHSQNAATAVSIQCLSTLYPWPSSRVSKSRNIDSRRRRKGKLSQGQQIASTSPRAVVGDGASDVQSPVESMVPLTE